MKFVDDDDERWERTYVILFQNNSIVLLQDVMITNTLQSTPTYQLCRA